MNDVDLVRVVEGLEDRAESYLTLAEVQAVTPEADLPAAVASGLLLLDHRTRADGASVTLCRLNRHHPLVARLTAW